jgi:Ca2+-binding EF-hand superfamily protein
MVLGYPKWISQKRQGLQLTLRSLKVFKTITLFASVLLLFGALIITAIPGGAQSDARSPQAAVTAYDTDKDGTIDENEVKTAAGAVFDRLDADKDGTLDEKELEGRVTKAQFREADPDNDSTLTKDEYLVFVTKVFRTTNRDNDSTVDVRELQSPSGRILIRLLQ